MYIDVGYINVWMLDTRLADKRSLTIYLEVVHKLQTLMIQNMLTKGESRDMSRIYIALQGYVAQTIKAAAILQNCDFLLFDTFAHL